MTPQHGWTKRLVALAGLALALAVGGAPTEAWSATAKKKAAATKVAAKPKKQKAQKVALRPKATKVTKGAKPTKVANTAKVAAVAPAVPVAANRSVVRLDTTPQAQLVPVKASHADKLGLRDAHDELSLNSSAALVVDQNTHEVIFSKNDKAVLPIASLTKLMTGMLVADANLPMDQEITITADDVDTIRGSSSRLPVGARLTRGEAMHLALMSSENRATHALGRTYPGGLEHFVRLMNAKARELGMHDTKYVEPTGLSSQNQSSARDLAILATAAYERPLLRELSTSPQYDVELGRRVVKYRNSNRLVDRPDWDIGLQKTGYISEAGRCLIMQVRVSGRQFIMVLLDAAGSAARLGDAERVRRWVETSFSPKHAAPAAQQLGSAAVGVVTQ